MDRTELLILLKQEVKGLASKLEDADFQNSIDDASRETGWTLPVGTDFKAYWLKNRAKRHLFFYLATESAYKFKFEQINLQHRFDHFTRLYKEMDEAFEKAVLENPAEFAGVDASRMFGTKIDAGFAYDPQTGIDITYDEEQLVEFGPKEND